MNDNFQKIFKIKKKRFPKNQKKNILKIKSFQNNLKCQEPTEVHKNFQQLIKFRKDKKEVNEKIENKK